MMAGNRYTDIKPAVTVQETDPFRREARFISLRWRLLVPLFAVVLAFAMIAAYLVTDAVTQGGQATQTQQLLLAVHSAAEGMQAFHADQVREATRIAYGEGIGQGVLNRDVEGLRRRLEADAAAANLDSVIMLDVAGMEVVGLLRASSTGWSPYAVSAGADLSDQPLVLALQAEDRPADASALLRTPQGVVVYTGVPLPGGEGFALVGARLERVLRLLRSSGLAQAALYDDHARLVQATFEPRGGLYQALTIAPEVFTQTLETNGQPPTRDLDLAGYAYQAAYLPFVVGRDVLGVLAVFLPSHLLYATDLSRQLVSLLTASLAGILVIGGYVAVGRVLGRIQRITATTQALARGDITARTGMRAADEIGELGRSLDEYADRTYRRQEALQTSLRRQRRENARLVAILESIPDGVVVLDLDGRVLLMNAAAQSLLGAQQAFPVKTFNDLTAVATDALGPAIAPGLYALGQPQRIVLSQTVLSAQAAAVMTISGRRVGTVILLRDILPEVRREQEREALLRQLSQDVQEPLQSLVITHPAESTAVLQDFAREIRNNAVRLQRLIADLRDLTDLGPEQMRGGQRPLSVEDLLNAAAVEWGPAAQAADLTIQVMLLQREMYILGDERRLRWALGNLIDNAIKFTQPGGQVRLLARQRSSEGRAELIVEDTGCGVRPEDQPHLFTRFYRGTPLLPDGSVLRVPGMGQGLFIARRVIEAHGGAIRLESRPGKGTRVICLLPLTAPVTMEVPDLARERVPLSKKH